MELLKIEKQEFCQFFLNPVSLFHTIRLLDTQKLISKVKFTLDKSDFQTKLSSIYVLHNSPK